MYIYICVHACRYVYISVCISVCVHACMDVCKYSTSIVTYCVLLGAPRIDQQYFGLTAVVQSLYCRLWSPGIQGIRQSFASKEFRQCKYAWTQAAPERNMPCCGNEGLPEGPTRLPIWNLVPITIYGSWDLIPYWQSNWTLWVLTLGITVFIRPQLQLHDLCLPRAFKYFITKVLNPRFHTYNVNDVSNSIPSNLSTWTLRVNHGFK